MNRFVIYGLTDPRTKQLRYIGMSKRGMKRPLQHTKPQSLKKNSYKNNWIKQLLTENQKPGIVIIQEFEEMDILAQAEVYWISYFRNLGCPLTNHCRGGVGFTGNHDEAWKALCSERSKRKWAACSQEERAEWGRKISEKRKGIPVTEEQKQRIAETLRGRKIPDSVLKKISKALTGKRRSQETKDRISATRIRPSEEEDLQITTLYRQGLSLAKISKIVGWSTPTCHVVVKRHGINRSIYEANSLPPHLKSQAIELYLQGNSIVGVAKSLNHSRRWVASVLKEAGIVRSLSQAYANRLAQKSQ